MPGFNSSQVVQKLVLVFGVLGGFSVFQFLIGSLETQQQFLSQQHAWSEFQFLIGSLETLLGTIYRLQLIGFNSSQVVQKLCGIRSNLHGVGKFQFLIGSLETTVCLSVPVSLPSFNSSQVVQKLEPGRKGCKLRRVSIPHRQSRNCPVSGCIPLRLPVSIPHRQSRN